MSSASGRARATAPLAPPAVTDAQRLPRGERGLVGGVEPPRLPESEEARSRAQADARNAVEVVNEVRLRREVKAVAEALPGHHRVALERLRRSPALRDRS